MLRYVRYIYGGGGGGKGIPDFTGEPPKRRAGLPSVNRAVCSGVTPSRLRMKEITPPSMQEKQRTVQSNSVYFCIKAC
jgi:hypothetical protein